jgi:DNA-binding transcriptional LysR family regulator
VLVVPTQYPLRQSRLRMKDLAGLPLMLMPADYCLRKMVEAECIEAHVKPKVVLEMTAPEGILQVVAEGAGLTILPELYVRLRSPGARFRIIELYDPVPHHSVGVVFLPNRCQNIAAKEFAALCRSTMAHLMTWSQSSVSRRGLRGA